MKKRIKLPPCPDPELFTAVKGKNGWYWRRKRGTVKPAKVNDVLKAFSDYAKFSMPAARRFIEKLKPYTEEFSLTSLTQVFSGFFTKSVMTEGKMSWSFFRDQDLNRSCLLNKLMPGKHAVSIEKGMCIAKIPLSHHMIETGRTGAITGFSIELILLSGDPAKTGNLRTESDISPVYQLTPYVTLGKKGLDLCTLSVQLPPRKPYMILLKTACVEGRFISGPKHTAMKVVLIN